MSNTTKLRKLALVLGERIDMQFGWEVSTDGLMSSNAEAHGRAVASTLQQIVGNSGGGE